MFLVARPVFAAEQIDRFDVTAKLNTDASVNVEEAILYDFGDAERHGIYRDLTVKYQARGGTYKLRVSDISVTDDTDKPYNFETSNVGDALEIKIGDADTTITGKHWYKIRYTVRRAINYFDEGEEFYWNGTGNGWDVPIMSSEIKVFYPAPLAVNAKLETCYAGPAGSTQICDEHGFIKDNSGQATGAFFRQKDLAAGEGITVVVGVPKGTILKPPMWQTILETVRDNGILILPIIIFIWLFLRWRKIGRDAKGRGTIIPEYEAPENMTAAEVGTLYDGRADNHDVSAQIIQLAVNGFLKIRREEEGKVFKSTDYIFTKLKPLAGDEKNFVKEIFDGLFAKGDETKLSDLKYKFASTMASVKNKLYANLTADKYFKSNPMLTKAKYFSLGCLAFFLAFMIGPFFGILGAVAFVLSAVVIGIFAFIMPAYTETGMLMKEKILGLKMYMVVAEEARIKFHNAPEKNPERFEKLLPYAMVMKVEKEWAEQFKDIYNIKPSWYDDPNQTGMFNTAILVGSLSHFDTAAAGTLSAAVSSGSSGGSGFSGGGSGGGFGGGGGGSW